MNKRINYWFVAISFLLLFMQPFFTWFSSDDFCLLPMVKANGLLRNMLHDYMFWDGRSISLTYPVCRAGLFAGLPWLGPLIGSLLLMLSAWLIFQLTSDRGNKVFQQLVSVITLTALLWLVFYEFLAQTLYWTTGVGYIMDIVMLLAALWWMRRWKGQRLDYLAGIPVFFYAGTCSPNGVLALLFVLAIEWLHEIVIQKRRSSRKYILAFLLILVALALVLLSPGNKNRMIAWDWNNLTHIWTIYFNIKQLTENMINYNSLFVWPLIAVGLAGALVKIISFNQKASGYMTKILNLIYETRLLLAAFISFFFFLLMPQFNSPRTAIQFAMYAALFGLSQMPYLLNSFADYKTQIIRNSMIWVHLIFIVTASTQLFDASYVKNQLQSRENRLRKSAGQNVTLSEEDIIRPPLTRRFEDISSDSSYWLNRCVASYYGLKSIALIDKRVKKGVFQK